MPIMINLTKTDWIEAVEYLPPVKFCSIQFRGCTEKKSKNVWANQRLRQPSWFLDQPEKHKNVKESEILLPDKFCWISFSGCREEVKNVSANQRHRPPSWFSDRSEKHKLCRGRWDLASSTSIFVEFLFSNFREEVENVSANQRLGQILVFLLARHRESF